MHFGWQKAKLIGGRRNQNFIRKAEQGPVRSQAWEARLVGEAGTLKHLESKNIDTGCGVKKRDKVPRSFSRNVTWWIHCLPVGVKEREVGLECLMLGARKTIQAGTHRRLRLEMALTTHALDAYPRPQCWETGPSKK